MKKSILFVIASAICIYANAQQAKNETVISIGTANNINGVAVQIGAQTSKASPVFNINVDRGMNERFSLGIAYCYQTINLDRQYYVTTSTSTTSPSGYTSYSATTSNGAYTENNIMQHVGIKFLFHSEPSNKGDFYGGLRLGYQFAKATNNLPSTVQSIISGTNANNNYYYNNGGSTGYTSGDANLAIRNKNRYTQQIVLGYRYFWDESFGVFAEGGLGFPYFMNFGLCLKF